MHHKVIEKTPRMLQIEKAHAGKEITVILVNTINRLGVMNHAAKYLGIDPALLTRWCDRLGIVRETSRTTISKTVAYLPKGE